MLRIERRFESLLAVFERQVAHLPSRVRSLLWILASLPVMAERGIHIATEEQVRADLFARLPTPEFALAELAAVPA